VLASCFRKLWSATDIANEVGSLNCVRDAESLHIAAALDGVTSFLFLARGVGNLPGALESALEDPRLAIALGATGRERALYQFRQETVRHAIVQEYLEHMQEKGFCIPSPSTPEVVRAGAEQSGCSLMRSFAKRLTDIFLSGIALFVLTPLMMAVALTIRLAIGHPVLFRQTRPGYGGKPFTMLKFRTMTVARDSRGVFSLDAERLTPIGKLLRQLSLDELPQLWNVLRGDMSLVGPRPLLMQYMDRYTLDQSRRHDVKPGITGWAQVNGRNAVTWSERFALDIWYVDHWNLLLDIRILFQTLWQVVKRDGISQNGHATMPEFSGRERNQP
jgi:sugar transferase EpsL